MKADECRAVFELLSQYLDRELPAETCEELERHIADCPPCVAFVDSLRKSVRLGQQYHGAVEPVPLADDVRRQLEQVYRTSIAARTSESR